MSDLSNTGPVTADEAEEILKRFVDGHFCNDGEHPRMSIPANPRRDDDLRLAAFIEQSAAAIETLEKAFIEQAALTEVETLRAAVQLAVERLIHQDVGVDTITSDLREALIRW